MPKIADPWDHHDWNSQTYVTRWAERQDEREARREEIFDLMAETIPYDREAAIKILDVGSGYGALTRFMLSRFSNATGVCQDGSEEMAKLGRKRMKDFKGRVQFVLSDFSKPGWSRSAKGPFEAVVSTIAIHNVRSPEIIKAIYEETFSVVKKGGCFLNFDRMRPSLEEQLKWLTDAGFKGVKCFGKDDKRALVGGFKK